MACDILVQARPLQVVNYVVLSLLYQVYNFKFIHSLAASCFNKSANDKLQA